MAEPDPLRYRAIKEALAEVLDLGESDRRAHLAKVRQSDPALALELETLVSSHAAAGDFLEWAAPDQRSPHAADDMIGRRLGNYRVVSASGHGGMGTVYLAMRADEQFERQVAIKLIHADLDQDAAARFRDERQILAALSHPSIAHLIDAGETEQGRPYIVMEHIEGLPITVHCDSLHLGVRQRVRLFLKVCGAVQFAHQNLVVHRDLKPSNILVTADGTPKLLDFGIAKILASAATSGRPSAPTALILTPAYASPEQVLGLTITTSADVYALGVLLYELLVGAGPYRSITRDSGAYATFEAICHEEPELPSIAARRLGGGRRLDAEIDALLLKALRKTPAERYGSVEQLERDLERYLDGLPVRARTVSAAGRVRKFVVRHWAGVAATAVVIASLLGATLVSLRQAAIARSERLRAEQRFDDVRELANAFVFEVDGAIQTLPGATAARKLIISRGLDYLERLSRDASDAALLRELAGAYQKIGDVQGNPFFPNLGDRPGAVASYARALELRARLLQLPGATDDDRAGFASALAGSGDLLWAAGDFESALGDYRRAFAIADRLATAQPANGDRTYARARAAYFVGQALTKLGRFEEATAEYRLSMSGYEAAATMFPDRGEYGRALAVALLKIGDCLSRGGDYAGALRSYERGSSIAAALMSTTLPAAGYARLRGFLLLRTALATAEAGDLPRALADAHAALDQAEALARADADDRQIRGDVASILSTIGALTLQLDRASVAADSLTRSLATFESLAREGLVSADQRSEYGVALRRAGDVERTARQWDRAYAHYQAALGQLESSPRDLEYEEELAVVYMRLAEAALTRANPVAHAGEGSATAREYLQASLDTWRRAEARGVRAGRLAPGGVSVLEAMLSRLDLPSSGR